MDNNLWRKSNRWGRRALAGLVLTAAAALTAAGCGPGTKAARGINPPRELPPPPPAQNIALDPTLRQQADQELTSALTSSDPLVRAHALEAVRDCGSTSHTAEILNALADSDSRIRFAAALAAGELKVERAHTPLLAMADDKSPNVRVAVRFALHRLGDTRYSHELEQLATYRADARVRGNTAFVLGLLGDPSALGILRVLHADEEVPVRQNAAEAMWRLGDQDGLKDLIALTVSHFADDQAFGYLALALPRDSVVRQHVRNGLISEDNWPEVPLIAARAMGMLGSDEGYSIAVKGAASSDARQRMLAALAFGAIGRSDAQEMLRGLLRDADQDVRIAAATAILELGHHSNG